MKDDIANCVLSITGLQGLCNAKPHFLRIGLTIRLNEGGQTMDN